MKTYIGTAMLQAKPMIKKDYFKHSGTKPTGSENLNEQGYLIRYKDGHEYWMEKKSFEAIYKTCNSMTFGIAMDLLLKGYCKSIARKGWNVGGLKIVYQKGYPDGIPCNKQTANAWSIKEGDLFKVDPYFQITTKFGSHSMWIPNIGDLFADDWYIVD